MRKKNKVVAGNWKMNLDKDAALKLASEVINIAKDEAPSDVKIVLCTSFVHLSSVKALLQGSNVLLGAQNCASKASGAYTGEVSASMLKSYHIDYVIIGHSERREYYKETHQELADKVNLVLQNGMKPIFCCGEVLAERQTNKQIEVVSKQLKESLFHLSADDFAKVVIAYEPVWAIGTGVTASSAQAQEMHAAIRKMLAEKYGNVLADAATIQYGGSCKPDNAKELFACPDVDGGLIGGASLKSRDFIDIVKSF
jgi:triosephosphate isomerase